MIVNNLLVLLPRTQVILVKNGNSWCVMLIKNKFIKHSRDKMGKFQL